MSSSYRKRAVRLAAFAIALAGLAAQGAFAQTTYFVPEVSLIGEYHSNRDMATGPTIEDQSVAGYTADLAATLGARTQRGSIDVRPNIQLQEYPDRDDLERTNQYLDVHATYGGLRSHFDMLARYSKEDEYKSELPAAGFDTFDPQNPDVTGTGRITSVSQHVTRLYARPSFDHELTQRLSLWLTGSYENVDYNLNGPDRVDYDSTIASAYLSWLIGQRTNINAGGYYANYKTEGNISNTDATGASLTLERRWTETFTGNFTVNAEHAKVDELGISQGAGTNVGFDVGVVKRDIRGQLRFQAGRSYQPTGGGARVKLDQVRVQYSRAIRPLWTLGTAARGFRVRDDAVSRADRDYLRGSIDLTRQFSLNWFATIGYDATWQRYKVNSTDVDDQVARLTITYRGLDPQR